jgi:hypothetical protein
MGNLTQLELNEIGRDVFQFRVASAQVLLAAVRAATDLMADGCIKIFEGITENVLMAHREERDGLALQLQRALAESAAIFESHLGLLKPRLSHPAVAQELAAVEEKESGRRQALLEAKATFLKLASAAVTDMVCHGFSEPQGLNSRCRCRCRGLGGGGSGSIKPDAVPQVARLVEEMNSMVAGMVEVLELALIEDELYLPELPGNTLDVGLLCRRGLFHASGTSNACARVSRDKHGGGEAAGAGSHTRQRPVPAADGKLSSVEFCTKSGVGPRGGDADHLAAQESHGGPRPLRCAWEGVCLWGRREPTGTVGSGGGGAGAAGGAVGEVASGPTQAMRRRGAGPPMLL